MTSSTSGRRAAEPEPRESDRIGCGNIFAWLGVTIVSSVGSHLCGVPFLYSVPVGALAGTAYYFVAEAAFSDSFRATVNNPVRTVKYWLIFFCVSAFMSFAYLCMWWLGAQLYAAVTN